MVTSCVTEGEPRVWVDSAIRFGILRAAAAAAAAALAVSVVLILFCKGHCFCFAGISRF